MIAFRDFNTKLGGGNRFNIVEDYNLAIRNEHGDLLDHELFIPNMYLKLQERKLYPWKRDGVT